MGASRLRASRCSLPSPTQWADACCSTQASRLSSGLGHGACLHSTDPTLRAMWPDGQQDITEVTKRPLTAGTLFKNSMVALVENLASKVIPAP